MAKIEKTQTEVTLSSETKRLLRNLTSALEKVARGMAMYKPQTDKWHDRGDNPMDVDTPKRLSEPSITLSAQTIQKISEAVEPQLVIDPDKV